MGRQTALPAGLHPRLLLREAAGAYVSVSPNVFDRLVQQGKMPPPIRLGDRRLAWDVRELDRFIDALPRGSRVSADEDTWSD